MTEAEALDEAAKAAGWLNWKDACHLAERGEIEVIRAHAATLMENAALKAENERLRGALDAVWKEATTMRNASKLVGPYPTNPADNRIWARSMYHAGKRIMEMLKPARAALGETK